MRHLSQEEIKLLEPSKGNFNCKCLPCGVHVEPVPLMSLTQTELVVALNKHFDFLGGADTLTRESLHVYVGFLHTELPQVYVF